MINDINSSQNVNRLTIRQANMEDLAKLQFLLQDAGYTVHINGHYFVFYKKGSVKDDVLI